MPKGIQPGNSTPMVLAVASSSYFVQYRYEHNSLRLRDLIIRSTFQPKIARSKLAKTGKFAHRFIRPNGKRNNEPKK